MKIAELLDERTGKTRTLNVSIANVRYVMGHIVRIKRRMIPVSPETAAQVRAALAEYNATGKVQ